jgi:hypothetical protein
VWKIAEKVSGLKRVEDLIPKLKIKSIKKYYKMGQI